MTVIWPAGGKPGFSPSLTTKATNLLQSHPVSKSGPSGPGDRIVYRFNMCFLRICSITSRAGGAGETMINRMETLLQTESRMQPAAQLELVCVRSLIMAGSPRT